MNERTYLYEIPETNICTQHNSTDILKCDQEKSIFLSVCTQKLGKRNSESLQFYVGSLLQEQHKVDELARHNLPQARLRQKKQFNKHPRDRIVPQGITHGFLSCCRRT